MSAEVPAYRDAGSEGHAAHHPASSRSDYLIGFGLSVVFTAIPFWLVISGTLGDNRTTAFGVMLFAAAQIIVHMVYFLHMNTRSEQGWTMMALIFTIIMVVIALTGSLWVMHHLTVNMMPMQDIKGMP